MKRLIQRLKGSKDLTIYERFLAGSSAGAFAQTLIYPLVCQFCYILSITKLVLFQEVLKTRLALRKSGELDKGLRHFANEMYKKEGFMCFYKVFY